MKPLYTLAIILICSSCLGVRLNCKYDKKSQSIDMSSVKDTTLIDNIKQYSVVKKLDISGNNLKCIPAEVFLLDSLETLMLNDNEITEIPSNIKKLTKLKVLWIFNNNISSFPDEIGCLNNLESIIISGNPISYDNLIQLVSVLPKGCQVVLNPYPQIIAGKWKQFKINDSLPELNITDMRLIEELSRFVESEKSKQYYTSELLFSMIIDTRVSHSLITVESFYNMDKHGDEIGYTTVNNHYFIIHDDYIDEELYKRGLGRKEFDFHKSEVGFNNHNFTARSYLLNADGIVRVKPTGSS